MNVYFIFKTYSETRNNIHSYKKNILERMNIKTGVRLRV